MLSCPHNGLHIHDECCVEPTANERLEAMRLLTQDGEQAAIRFLCKAMGWQDQEAKQELDHCVKHLWRNLL